MDKNSIIDNRNLLQNMVLGALIGAKTWAIYAMVESCLLSLVPWLLQPSYMYTSIHLGFTALLLTLFPLFGSLLGSAVGVAGHFMGLARVNNRALSLDLFCEGMMLLSVIVLFFGHLVQYSWRSSPLSLTIIGVSMIVISAWVLVVWFPKWGSRLTGIVNVWTVSVLLIGTIWFRHQILPTVRGPLSPIIDVSTEGGKTMLSIAFVVVVLIVAMLCTRYSNRRSAKSGAHAPSFFSSSFGVIVALLIIFTLNLFMGQGVYTDQSYTQRVTGSSGLPNVLLISLDTTRADHLSLYGYARNTTPNLNKFAENAIVFNRAIATGDMTLPTHASIFTGLYPLQHGAHNDPPEFWNARPLSDQFLTLTEILAAHQYLTLGVVSNYGYLGHGLGIPQGFNYYDNKIPVVFLKKVNRNYLSSWIPELLQPFLKHTDYDVIYRDAEIINREVFKLLDNRSENEPQPFFLFVNYMDPHFPYIPPPPFDTRYPGKLEDFDTKYYSALYEAVLEKRRSVTEAEYKHMVSQYDGEIAYLDYHLGELFARLKASDLFDNTLIIITSDHGEAFGERDLIQHAVSVYQDQVHVPLVLKFPNSKKFGVINQAVSSVDILPTVLDVLGIEMQLPNVQGKSLRTINHEENRAVMTESYPDGGLRARHQRFMRIERAVVSGALKLIQSTANKHELYDLEKDPNELNNLFEIQAADAEQLTNQLSKWMDSNSRITDSQDNTELDPEVLTRLKALGYIQ